MKKIWNKFFGLFGLLLFGIFSVNAANSQFVSPYQSRLQVEKNSATADGVAVINIFGTVQNAYGDRISNAKIEISADKDFAEIQTSRYSDSNGNFTGKIVSKKSGLIALTATANGEKLFDSPTVVFSLPKKSPSKNVGASGSISSFLKAQLFDDTEDGAHNTEFFAIDGVDSAADTAEKLSVTVTAKDESGNTDPTYTGTVRFAVSTDPNAELPVDYSFTPEDQGVHTFHLALSFNAPGEHQLAVQDLDDVRISGTFDVTVADADGNDNSGNDNSDPEISIVVPKNGAILSTPRITILGNAQGCSVVTLMDGDTVLDTNISTSTIGDFTFQPPGLAHGPHEFRASCTDNSAIESELVTVQIDREGPAVMTVDISAQDKEAGAVINPGDVVLVNVGADEEISNAKFSINGGNVGLVRKDGRNFEGTFLAPEIGDYPYTASIFDALGNETHESPAGILPVVGANNPLVVTLSKNPVKEGETVTVTVKSEIAMNNPSAIMNGLSIPLVLENETTAVGTVIAPEVGLYPVVGEAESASNGARLAPENDPELRVTGQAMSARVSENPTTPNAALEMMVSSDKEMASAQCVVNGEELSLTAKSGTEFAAPFTAPEANGDYSFLCTATYDGGVTESQNGTFVVASDFVNAPPTAVDNLQAKAGKNKVTLFWTPSKDDVGVKQYKIKYNVCGEPLNQLNITPDDRTQWYVDGLKNHVKYCFSVTPIDIDGKEGVESEMAEATPAGTKNVVEKAPTSGANSSWINALIVFAVGLAFVFIKRRRES